MGLGLNKIEQFLMAAYMVALLVVQFFMKGIALADHLPSLLLLSLSMYWLYHYKTEWKLLMVMVLNILTIVVSIAQPQYFQYFQSSLWMVLIAVSLFFFYKHSKAYKSLEMMEGLLVLFTIGITASLMVDLGEQSNLLYFGLAYVLFTIMYNDNIWERFTHAENRLFIFMLLISLKSILTYVVDSWL
jgi:hypothetical protein